VLVGKTDSTTKCTKDTKHELKKVNHKGHKDHIGREARKIEFLRPLSFDVAQDGELVEPRSLRLNHPKGTAMAVPQFVTFVLFVVKFPLSFGCGFAALGPSWSMTPPQQTRTR
jgi:hypothetical protein